MNSTFINVLAIAWALKSLELVHFGEKTRTFSGGEVVIFHFLQKYCRYRVQNSHSTLPTTFSLISKAGKLIFTNFEAKNCHFLSKNQFFLFSENTIDIGFPFQPNYRSFWNNNGGPVKLSCLVQIPKNSKISDPGWKSFPFSVQIPYNFKISLPLTLVG